MGASLTLSNSTLLHEAIRYEQAVHVRTLVELVQQLEADVPVEEPTFLMSHDAAGLTPLSLSVVMRHGSCTAELLSGGAPLLSRDRDDSSTPLHHAVSIEDAAAVRLAPPYCRPIIPARRVACINEPPLL